MYPLCRYHNFTATNDIGYCLRIPRTESLSPVCSAGPQMSRCPRNLYCSAVSLALRKRARTYIRSDYGQRLVSSFRAAEADVFGCRGEIGLSATPLAGLKIEEFFAELKAFTKRNWSYHEVDPDLMVFFDGVLMSSVQWKRVLEVIFSTQD